MGVKLAPIIVKEAVTLEAVKGKCLAVDANNVLHQFLALVRKPNGTPLTDSEGRVTSHLTGLMFRVTRLIYDYDVKPVFVFDGEPHELKKREVAKRRELKEKALQEWWEALSRGDYATAFSKAVVTGRLTKPMVDDAKKLLQLLGIPYVEAPSEAEAQAAYMALKGDVWASNSRDYDSLLFGSPRLVRYVTITGVEYLPSKGVARRLTPEIIELAKLLAHHGITREQLVDLAILVGTDFNDGIKGLGPKKALKLIKRYRKLEALPLEVKAKLTLDYDEVRRIFLNPKVTDSYDLSFKPLREEALYRFLCDERSFSEERVGKVVERMKSFYARRDQASIDKWVRKA